MTIGKKVTITSLIIIMSVLIFVFRNAAIPVLDVKTDGYFEDVGKKAVSAYAVTRGVNAIVSVIKESELYISPAGVGVSIAAGQVLDPVDDLTEKLSNIIVLSIVSIGMQKIAFEVGQLFSFQFIAILLPLLLLPIWLPGSFVAKFGSITFRVILVLFILRFFLPGSMLVNNFFYNEFMVDNISATKDKLRIITEGSSGISKFDTIVYEDGVLETLNSSLNSMTAKIERMKELYNKIRNNLGSIMASLLDLTMYYSTIFLIQVLLIPIMVLWLTIKVVNSLFNFDFKVQKPCKVTP